MQPRAVAGLAVGIDRAAMPHRLQRTDRRLDDAPRRAPVGRGDDAAAARAGFDLGAVHALTGQAGERVAAHHVDDPSMVLSISCLALLQACLSHSSPALLPICPPTPSV